jgi:glyoxylase-like metal-dependent hydrolase (beta-lactamase superfamily II)
MEFKRLADGVYYSTPDEYFDQPCLFAVVGERYTLMVDGGVAMDRAGEFIARLGRETGRGPDFAAVTHWHWDHTFGLPGIDAPVIACAKTARHLERMAGYDSWSDEALEARVRSGEEAEVCAGHIRLVYPGEKRGGIAIRLPDIAFDEYLELDLGGLTCRLRRLPPVHTDDCVAIHVPERDVLILGDCMYCSSSYDPPRRYSARPVLELLDYIRGTGARILLDSHTGPATPQEFWQYNGMLEAAAEGVVAGIAGKDALLRHMAERAGGALHGDAGEIAGLFIAGIEYDNRRGEAVPRG